jgi:hypothetical protein
VAHELEARMMVEVVDVALGAGKEVVDAKNFVALVEQPVGQVGAQEPGTTVIRMRLRLSYSLAMFFPAWFGYGRSQNMCLS